MGLAIVALALNQGWPLIEGSSMPQIPPPRQGVGEATIVAGVEAVGAPSESAAAADRQPQRPAPGDAAERGSDGLGSAAVPAPAASTDLVVSPSAPSKPRGGGAHGSPDHQSQPATPQQPSQPPPAPPPVQAPAEPVPSPASPPVAADPGGPSATDPSPPSAASEATPDASSVPSWSNGKGHAYGRSDDWDGHGHD